MTRWCENEAVREQSLRRDGVGMRPYRSCTKDKLVLEYCRWELHGRQDGPIMKPYESYMGDKMGLE